MNAEMALANAIAIGHIAIRIERDKQKWRMGMKLDLKVVRDQITNLLAVNPELEEDDILRADMIEGETEAFEFLRQLVHTIGDAEAKRDGLKKYIDLLDQREGRLGRRIMVLRNFAKLVMESTNLRKVELAEATLSIRNGPPRVVITNEHEIPDEFWRIKREPDKTKIKTTIQSGNHVNGAALSNGEPSLSILIR